MRVKGSTLAAVAAASMISGCSRHVAPSAGEAPPASASVASTMDGAVPDAASEITSPIPKEVVEKMLNPNHLPAYTGKTGSVEGTIFVKGEDAPDEKVDTTQCHAALDTYGKFFREGPPNADGLRPLADAVIIAVGYSGFYVEEKNPTFSVKITENCAYPARTIALTYGQRLDISNASKLGFAPRLDNDPNPAVMLAPPQERGDPIHLYPRIPGHAYMVDYMQPYVREDVYIFRHPLHAVSGLDGHYRIDGIPVGKMTIGAQHPTVLSQAQSTVTIEAGVVQKADFTLEYDPKKRAEIEANVRADAGTILR
ncbi:MAG TPA: carboxypeptidase-like regulatory domain-containing protein [Polyangiaceae bacterium]|jgi:hypothetical protein|nr:carboxypeptidase-like regulatory domain-containing protein [Polyangiaceae bacterium]